MRLHLYSKVKFYREKTPTLIIKIGANNGVVLNGKPFSKVIVHIGDATAYSALNSLAEKDTAVIIVDPIAYAALGLIKELQDSPEMFGNSLGEDVVLRNTLLSFYNATQFLGKERIQKEYLKLWEKAKDNVENLFIVESGIDELLAPAAFVDEVTYFYPYREDTLETAFLFAMHALRPGGKFVVVTEMASEGVKDIYPRHDFVSLLRDLARQDGDLEEDVLIERKIGTGPYFSGYDMVFDRKEPRLVTITRRKGDPPKWQDEAKRRDHLLKRKARWTKEEL